MKNNKEYYLGLDIGTDSVGYAVSDKQYNLLKFHGEPAWGVTIFDEAHLSSERRSFRSARRRLDRRQQRVNLLQELFAKEIAKVDERFFIRIKESALYREDVDDKYTLFNDCDYTDKDYYAQYPTIHHLICELMNNKEPHDARLVYLACEWLVAHRGHFLSNIDKNNLSSIKDFDAVYNEFISFFTNNEYKTPWENINVKDLENCLKKKIGVNDKYKELCEITLSGTKPSKIAKEEEPNQDFPFSQEGILKLLAGGTYSLRDLFGKDAYADLETKSITLGMDEDKFSQIMSDIGDDYEIIAAMRSIYDWTVLIDALGKSSTISEAKVAVYEQHKDDLTFLKYIIKKYKSEKYNDIFRMVGKDNYASYAHHSDEKEISLPKKSSKEDFSKFILGILKGIEPQEEDKTRFDEMITRLELRIFLPKQKDTDNRVIPHQLYWYELHTILQNASTYLSFLNEKDESGKTVFEKIESVFLFRIPYFVGPLNSKSEYAWLSRRPGVVYPWNFEDMVDLDESENYFIRKMTNKCTYLPGEDVLPKSSLLYQKFSVLNEINNIKINGENISVEIKQEIYNEVFLNKKKVTRKYLINYLIANGYLEKDSEDSLTGIDININSSLSSHIAFSKLIKDGILDEADVERIIERSSYAEDKTRLSKWLISQYPQINEEDRKYIVSLKLKDFGRLSRTLLNGITGIDRATGELTTIITALWNTQNNLMEIIEDENKYTFKSVIEDFQKDYYSSHKMTLNDRLDDMYLSNSVRRPVFRTLDIVKDVVKAFGVPEKIFVEMTRGTIEDKKGKRTTTRKQQILDLYKKCNDEDVRALKEQLEAMGDYADNKLQGDKLFLYYMQLGKCMYSGKPIDLEKLGTTEYDIDHIWPQAFVKDDSIINNKVLCLSVENGNKKDKYPIAENIRHNMHGYWNYLKDVGLISEEKYKRLTRSTSFTEEEKFGFINRQLTETSQSTKAVATLLKEKYPNTEIVYCKSNLTSDFRHEFDIYKCRSFNDLHHAVDAYLNIVTGNVYNMKFTKKWFNINSNYSVKTRTIFTHPVICGNETVWDGENMLAKVKTIATKNNAHFTKYSTVDKSGFYKQTILPASYGLERKKKYLPTEKYGGFSGLSTSYLLLVKYKVGKKSELIFFPVPVLYAGCFENNEAFAKEYIVRALFETNNKKISDVEILLEGRKIKLSSMLSLDGFNVFLCSASLKDGRVGFHVATQYSDSNKAAYYLKKLEMLVTKSSNNKNYIYDEQYDNVSADNNIELYQYYIDKLHNSIYSKRPGNGKIVEELEKSSQVFASLSIVDQAKTLLQIHNLFSRNSNDGVDLSLLNMSNRSAKPRKSLVLNGWKSDYSDVHIIDSSASGLWSKKSVNLLELL